MQGHSRTVVLASQWPGMTIHHAKIRLEEESHDGSNTSEATGNVKSGGSASVWDRAAWVGSSASSGWVDWGDWGASAHWVLRGLARWVLWWADWRSWRGRWVDWSGWRRWSSWVSWGSWWCGPGAGLWRCWVGSWWSWSRPGGLRLRRLGRVRSWWCWGRPGAGPGAVGLWALWWVGWRGWGGGWSDGRSWWAVDRDGHGLLCPALGAGGGWLLWLVSSWAGWGLRVGWRGRGLAVRWSTWHGHGASEEGSSNESVTHLD